MYRRTPRDESLVVLGGNGRVVAIEAESGRPVWAYTPWADDGAVTSERVHRARKAPIRMIIDGPRVIGLADRLFCLELATGREAWAIEAAEFVDGAIAVRGESVVIARAGRASCFDVRDGSHRWSHALPGLADAPTSIANEVAPDEWNVERG